MAGGKKFQNRLAREKSPYLLQHADNPVDWYPWGEEAFTKARQEDKPIFLSIGYSTCHWCHVMEHESFENEEIARMINSAFVPVKVDREERPDIDAVYMKAVVAMTGRGGWPLTVFLTPDKKPFFGGMYFPAQAKWGSPGLTDLIHSISEAWAQDRDQLVRSGAALTEALAQNAAGAAGMGASALTEETLKAAFAEYARTYDTQYGGFGDAPKFPSGHALSFLLRYGKRYADPLALSMAQTTLKAMAAGGMYDHLGGGFHRYATDRQWQVPHFEKMLYDQAMLAQAYLEAYQATRDESYAAVAREILDYVLREMRHPDGGFYSAEDADSLDEKERETKEGAFYLWTHEQVSALLGDRDAHIFNYRFGIKPEGNALVDPQGEFKGKNIIYVDKSLEEAAAHFKMPVEDVRSALTRGEEKLFKLRRERPRPHLDDKVLTDWNGLMIASLSFGARVLDASPYREAAKKSADFILERLVDEKGRLLHRYRDGEAAVLGSIEDYAFLIHGLLGLYEATFEVKYLRQAQVLAKGMVERFWDEMNGGFYFTADDAEQTLFRLKEVHDGAVPSGNSFAALDLVRLYLMTFDTAWEEKLEHLFKAFAPDVNAYPAGYAHMLIAFDFILGPSQEVVLAGEKADPGVTEMLRHTNGRFLPRKVMLLHPSSGPDKEGIEAIAPFVKNQNPIAGKPTAYVCENHVCKMPAHEVKRFLEVLDQLK